MKQNTNQKYTFNKVGFFSNSYYIVLKIVDNIDT